MVSASRTPSVTAIFVGLFTSRTKELGHYLAEAATETREMMEAAVAAEMTGRGLLKYR